MLDWYAVNFKENKEKGYKALEALIEGWNDLKEYATIGEVQQACFRLMRELSEIPYFYVSFQLEDEFRIVATVSTYNWHETGKEELEGIVFIDVYHTEEHDYWLELDWKENDKR